MINSVLAKNLPMDLVKKILKYDNHIIRNGEIVKINKIDKLDERYKKLYYTFNDNPNVGDMHDKTHRDIMLILKSGRCYMLVYDKNETYIGLMVPDNSDEFINHMYLNILYKHK